MCVLVLLDSAIFLQNKFICAKIVDDIRLSRIYSSIEKFG